MAVGIVRNYRLVICGLLPLLCLPHCLLAAVLPTDNATMWDSSALGNASITTGDIWEITETAGNGSAQNPDVLLLRGGWITKNQNSKIDLETDEGWLNSGIIAKDAFVPYRSVDETNRLGNSSEDWKKLLVKPEVGNHQEQSRVSKVRYNERRGIPFRFHWQINPKRFNSSKAP